MMIVLGIYRDCKCFPNSYDFSLENPTVNCEGLTDTLILAVDTASHSASSHLCIFKGSPLVPGLAHSIPL